MLWDILVPAFRGVEVGSAILGYAPVINMERESMIIRLVPGCGNNSGGLLKRAMR
jgi:hypothetical protein